MIFSPDHSAIYVSVPKTGCTTIKMLVAASAGLLDSDFLTNKSSGRIHTVFRWREQRWTDLTDDERRLLLFGRIGIRFTSIRNPFERIVSCYLNKIAVENPTLGVARRLRAQGDVTMLSFLRYIADQPPLRRDVHCRAMTDLCYSGRVTYDDIVRYESFEADLRRIMEKLNVSDLSIPKPAAAQKTNAGARINDLLGQAECDLIRKLYEDDFETFGYSKQLKPA
jgi:hypothetical protein